MRKILAVLFILLVPISASLTYAQSATCNMTLGSSADADAYIARSTACLDIFSRNPDKALADADRAVALAPDRADAYAARAWAHLWQRSFGQAIADTTVAITLEPDNPKWHRARSFYMLQVADVEGSLADIEQAIGLAPDDTDLYLYRSDNLEQLGRTDEAIVSVQEAIALEPDNAELIQRLGDLYFTTGQDQLALETYQRFVETAAELSPSVNARLMILEDRLANDQSLCTPHHEGCF